MARLIGKNADVEVNGAAVVGFKEWSASESTAKQDVSGFDNSGLMAYAAGLDDVSISFNGTWDSSEAKLYGNPPVLSKGVILTSFKGYLDATKYCELTDALIDTFNVSVSATGVVTFNGTLCPTSTSTWTNPAS